MRFAAVLKHVTQHRRCTGKTLVGDACKSMTNYVCLSCDNALCGRHCDRHGCPPPVVNQ